MPPRHIHPAHRTLLLVLVAVIPAAFHMQAVAQTTLQEQATDGPSSASSQSNGHQGRRPGPPSPAMELDRLTKAMMTASLPLTDAQKVTILGILEDRETAQRSLQSSPSDRAAVMQQMQSLEKASHTAILAVLTEAQQKVYATLRQGPPNGNGMPSSPPSGSDEHADSNIDANTGGGVQQPAP